MTCRIGLGKTFAEKHRCMRLMFELATKVDKSSWSVRVLHSDCRNNADIDHFVLSEEDAWHFLHKVRRLARRGGLWDGPPQDRCERELNTKDFVLSCRHLRLLTTHRLLQLPLQT